MIAPDEIGWPGYYKVRLVRRGPWVPARVTFDGLLWRAETNGEAYPDAWDTDSLTDDIHDSAAEGRAFDHPLLRIILFGVPVDEAEHRYLTELGAYARKYAPDHPAANPRKRINLRTLRPLF